MQCRPVILDCKQTIQNGLRRVMGTILPDVCCEVCAIAKLGNLGDAMTEGLAGQAAVSGGTKRARGSDGGVVRQKIVLWSGRLAGSVIGSDVGVGEEMLTGDDKDRLWANVTRKARRGSRAKLSHI